jgi:hypothetical protein
VVKTGLYIDPPSQLVPPGPVSVDIASTDLNDLGSYDITVSWDESILQFDSFTNGALLGSSGRTVLCQPPSVDVNSAQFNCITLGILPGVSGAGMLATINFTAIAEGTSKVALGPVSLQSTAAADLDLAVTDGTITVDADGILTASFYCGSNDPVTSNSGDNDGFEVSPNKACDDDGAFAQDMSTGTNNTSTCWDAGKDRHDFTNFHVDDVISDSDSIAGLEVLLDAKGSSNAYLCAELSWDDGNTWTPAQFTTALGPSEALFTLGSQADTWGHTWSGEMGDFVVRLTSVSNTASADVYLDSVGVRVSYLP